MKKLVFTAVILAMVLFACSRGPRGLFRVGSEEIFLEDWMAFQAEGGPKKTPQGALDRFVSRERAVLASQDLLRDRRIQSLLIDEERELLEKSLVDARVAQMAPPTEEELEAFFQRRDAKRRVRHILLADEPSARRCLDALKKGRSFESVAQKESTDKKSAEKGGDIGWVTQDQLVLPFARAAFSLPVGKFSEPVQTEYGFHILEVTEIQPPDPAGLAKNRAEIEKALLSQRRAMQEHLIQQEAKAKVPITPRNPIPEEGISAPPETLLCEVGKEEKITLGDLDLFLQNTFGRDPQGHGMGATVKADMLKKMGERLQVAALASQEGIRARPDFQGKLREARRAVLYTEAVRRLVADKTPDDADLEAFFKNREPSLAKNPEVKLSILVMGDIQRLDALAKTVRAGEADFETLVRKESSDRETAEQGGNIGWLGRKLLMELLQEEGAEAVLAKEPGAIVGPFRTPMGTVLFQVNEKREGTPFVLGDIRDKVLKIYRSERGTEMARRWTDSLEGSYPLRIRNRAALGLDGGGK